MEFRSERERYLGTENRANRALNIIAMKWKIVSTLEEIESGMGEKKTEPHRCSVLHGPHPGLGGRGKHSRRQKGNIYFGISHPKPNVQIGTRFPIERTNRTI